MNRLFLCLVYVLPMVATAGENEETKDPTETLCFMAEKDDLFTSHEDEGHDHEEGTDRFASNDEDRDPLESLI